MVLLVKKDGWLVIGEITYKGIYKNWIKLDILDFQGDSTNGITLSYDLVDKKCEVGNFCIIYGEITSNELIGKFGCFWNKNEK